MKAHTLLVLLVVVAVASAGIVVGPARVKRQFGIPYLGGGGGAQYANANSAAFSGGVNLPFGGVNANFASAASNAGAGGFGLGGFGR